MTRPSGESTIDAVLPKYQVKEGSLPVQREFLTTVEAASTLNLYPETVKRFCHIGKFHCEKVSVGWVISKIEPDSFANTYSETPIL